MPEKTVTFEERSRNLRKNGEVVGQTDRVYDVTGHKVSFQEVVVSGDLTGDVSYNGRTLRIVRVDTMIGLEVTQSGVRGPVWKGVDCDVVV
jgi:hypothetical protein